MPLPHFRPRSGDNARSEASLNRTDSAPGLGRRWRIPVYGLGLRIEFRLFWKNIN